MLIKLRTNKILGYLFEIFINPQISNQDKLHCQTKNKKTTK